MKTLFEYSDYKSYLTTILTAGKARSGLRAKLAAHLGCQTAHISQVLNGASHFSVEQAFRISPFLGHDREESHFFFLMVNKDRAGTKELQAYYQTQLDEILKRRSLIKNRVNVTKEVPQQQQSRYYSSWHYLAIHMALSIPELQTKESLADYFRLPLLLVAEALEFLTSAGLAQASGGRYTIGPFHVHIGHDTDNINKHHSNWRVQAMDSLMRPGSQDLHYSVVYSLSRKDAEKIKERIIAMIRENLDDIAPSKEEVLYCSAIDFFEMKK